MQNLQVNDMKTLLKGLQANNEPERVELLNQLEDAILDDRIDSSLEKVITEGLRGEFPDDNDEVPLCRLLVLTALSHAATDKTIPFIARSFASLPDNPAIRAAALRCLALMESEEALDLLLDLLTICGDETQVASEMFLSDLAGNPLTPTHVFPRILKLLPVEQHKPGMYELIEACLRDNLLDETVLLPYRDQIVADWRVVLEMRKEVGDELAEASVFSDALRGIVEAMGALNADDDVVECLQVSTTDENPLVRMVACFSSLKLGLDVSKECWRDVAAAPIARLPLRYRLEEIGHLDLFPKEFNTPEMIAEADMTACLMDPDEGDGEPERLELIEKRKAPWDGVPGFFFLYKFQYPDESAWYVGMSGPHALPGIPAPEDWEFEATNTCWSRLEEMSLGEHFAELMERAEELADF